MQEVSSALMECQYALLAPGSDWSVKCEWRIMIEMEDCYIITCMDMQTIYEMNEQVFDESKCDGSDQQNNFYMLYIQPYAY